MLTLMYLGFWVVTVLSFRDVITLWIAPNLPMSQGKPTSCSPLTECRQTFLLSIFQKTTRKRPPFPNYMTPLRARSTRRCTFSMKWATKLANIRSQLLACPDSPFMIPGIRCRRLPSLLWKSAIRRSFWTFEPGLSLLMATWKDDFETIYLKKEMKAFLP